MSAFKHFLSLYLYFLYILYNKEKPHNKISYHRKSWLNEKNEKFERETQKIDYSLIKL